MKKKEDPCTVDGEPCVWVVEEEYTMDGDLVEDEFCEKCYRYRDPYRRNERSDEEVKANHPAEET